MQKVPRVTVLMTLYNKGPYVEEAVHSVLAQTFTDFDLLVVDDASTDGGLEKVKAFHDPRIRILESPKNTGRAAAANRGYDAATGEYLAVLDADDLMHPERLAKQVAFMEAHPRVGISGSYHQSIGRSDHVGRWPLTDLECRSKMLFRDPVLYGSSIIRRSVLERQRLRCNPNWLLPGMDYLFVLSIGQHGEYANLPEPLLYYRLGSNNMRHGRELVRDKRGLIEAVFNMFGLPISPMELSLQLVLNDVPPVGYNARRVGQLRAWTKDLVELNRKLRPFPLAGFEQEVERRWNMVYHRIADQSLSGGLAHLRHSTDPGTDRALYLLKTTINRWIGRKPELNH